MRLLEIVFYLLRSNCKITIKELASVYNVSTRTIQRDLDKLSVLGIPIIIHRGKNGGIEIDNNYIIRRQMLRYNDDESLMLALYICENISKNLEKSLLIDRFKIVDEKRCSKILNKLQERFIVDLYEEKFDSESEVCKKIDKALDNKTFIEVEINRGKICIFPISYVLRQEGLCLYYYDEEYKLIPIKNIDNVVLLNKSYNGNIISYNDNKKSLKIV